MPPAASGSVSLVISTPLSRLRLEIVLRVAPAPKLGADSACTLIVKLSESSSLDPVVSSASETVTVTV